MNVLFVYNGAENLGIEYLSSFLKVNGHHVDLAFDPAVFSGDYLLNNKSLAQLLNLDNRIIEKVKIIDPDLVAFSVFTGNYRWSLNIAEKIKDENPNLPVVFGGVHATALPEKVLANDCVDFVIVGEGEYALVELVDALGNNGDYSSIANLFFKDDVEIRRNSVRNYIRDLDSLPFPDKALFYDKVPSLSEDFFIITSRGCPYKCTYCSNDMYLRVYREEKNHLRRRSPENCISELIEAKEEYPVKYVTFEDDVFTVDYEWLKDFARDYVKKINLPFKCSLHPLSVNGKKVELLKKMGCQLVKMGVQSGSPRIRKEIFLRGGSNEQIAEVSALVKRAGIMLSLDNIFGAPSEGEQDLLQGLELYRKIKPNRISTFWLTYYPETSIINYGKNFGILSDRDIENIENGDIGFAHSTGSVKTANRDLYKKYQVLYQLSSLIHHDLFFLIASRLFNALPFKGFLAKLVMGFNMIKGRDIKAFYVLKYIIAKKDVP